MKKKNKQFKTNRENVSVTELKNKKSSSTDKKTTWLIFILSFVCILFYGNTSSNNYCLDDAMVITDNSSTLKGFSGIKEQINQDLLFGYKHIKSKNASSAGWRPLSLITYSMEIGLWGKNKPGYSHVVNMLIYACIVILLFLLLYRHLLKDLWLSFFAALLFAIHPVHSEVVANIKSRDELLCLFFMLLSLRQLFRFIVSKNKSQLYGSLILFFISLTAKENSFTFIAGIPVILYFFTGMNRNKILLFSSGYVLAGVLYLLIRNAFVPFSNVAPNLEIINNSFLNAVGSEGIATKIFLLLIYARLLIFPYPLSYDYSYRQIPYYNFSSPFVWVSIVIGLVLIVYAWKGIRSKNIISFCILMFIITFSISSNFIFEIGTMIGERFLFMPSVFFCIALAVVGKTAVEFIVQKTSVKKATTIGIFIFPVFTASAVETISRNSDWKDDYTLGLADLNKSPNSARANNAGGASLLFYSFDENHPGNAKDSLLKTSVIYFKKSLEIFPEFNDAELNLGVAYNQMDSLDKAEECWNIVRARTPGHPKLKIYDGYLANHFINIGIDCGRRNVYDSSVYYFNRALNYCNSNDSLKLSCFYNLGGVYFTMGNYTKAHDAFGKVMEINPGYLNAKEGYNQSESLMNKK